jgi:hypothetical protein
MPTDYARIRDENIREYGEGTRHLKIISELYADRTHFVFELLQNAEDALKDATAAPSGAVRFALYPDRLEFGHFGRAFDDRDVRGVCGIGVGTKADDLTKIGKFGIGFKAVYAFTRRPEVHSGDEHFRIEHYVRPHPVPPRAGQPGQTLFVLPFDREDTPASYAFEAVAKRLESLDTKTLLFLRHVTAIEWSIVDGDGRERRGRYARQTSQLEGGARRVRVADESGGGGAGSAAPPLAPEDWLVFERPVDTPDRSKRVAVECAFRLRLPDAPADAPRVVRADASPLVVYFPTAKETNLGFLIQGPYRTTSSRDNVRLDDAWNLRLVDETASLVGDALVRLRDLGHASVGLLETLPLNADHFRPGSLLRPIFDGVRRALNQADLLPAHGGGFVPASQAVLARGADLRGLLSPGQLADLLRVSPTGAPRPLRWLAEEITLDRTPEVWGYLTKELSVPVVDPEAFAAHFSTEFVERQPDEWVARLYAFLDGVKHIWRPGAGAASGALRARPFVRLESGRHVAPFRADGMPNAYLPPDGTTAFPTVRRVIARDPKALAFLQALGLQEPDAVGEILEHVLPRYQGPDTARIGDREHQEHVRQIVRTYREISLDRRDALSAQLRKTEFVRAFNPTARAVAFKRPGVVYADRPELRRYFEGSPYAFFVYGYTSEELATLKELGVAEEVRINASRTEQRCEIDGLPYALRAITPEKAAYIWNRILVPHQEHLRATSGNVDLLKERQWLPAPGGGTRRPADLAASELPAAFLRAPGVAQRLGMRPDAVDRLARELGVDVDLLSFVAANPELVRGLKARHQAQAAAAIANGSDGPADDEPAGVAPDGVGYRELFQDAFSRPGNGAADPDLGPGAGGPVADPARRRAAVQADIQRGRQDEPPPELRFRQVPRKAWEAKDYGVRIFLEEQYQGHCQICNRWFPKRDGAPYFEGVYIVSYTRARWIDRAGNVLSLCPTCCAMFQHGAVEADQLLDQVLAWRAAREEGARESSFNVKLCGQRVPLRFTERHLIDLQELLRAESGESATRLVA